MAHWGPWARPSPEVFQRVFSEKLAARLSNSDISPTMTFEEFLWLNIAEVTPLPFKADLTSPRSVLDYTTRLSTVLSDFAQQQILSNAAQFDTLVGFPVADSCITRYTFARLLFYLANEILNSARLDAAASATASSRSLVSTFSTPPSSFGAGSSYNRRPPPLSPMGFDGPFDGPFDRVPHDDKIVQVKLEGPDITTAWRNNTTIIDRRLGRITLQDLERKNALKVGESPAQGGGPPVFHGTSGHLKCRNWQHTWYADKLNLSGNHPKRQHRNGVQMNPHGVAGVYTGFSPMRCFLYAAFKGQFYSNVPCPRGQSCLNQDFTAGDRIFTGVALFVFDSIDTPCPPSCTGVTLSNDVASEAFAKRVIQLNEKGGDLQDDFWAPDKAWQALKQLTGQGASAWPDSWPDLLHSHEYGEQKRLLAGIPYQMNLWRTLWVGKGIDYLNQRYKYTVVISFEKKDPPPKPLPARNLQVPKPAPKKDDDDDDDKGGKKGGKGGKGGLKGLALRAKRSFQSLTRRSESGA